jgi:CRISPR/Cas system Type II protein with McrA/HNH and RuvC-like nuclease domain
MDYKKTMKKYIYERDDRKCRFCQRELLFRKISLDHYLPKSKKGPDDLYNLVLCCKKCNKLKKNRTPSDYESVMIENFIKGIKDRKITAPGLGIKNKMLLEMAEAIERIEDIGEDVVFQSSKHRFYVKKGHIKKIVNIGESVE